MSLLLFAANDPQPLSKGLWLLVSVVLCLLVLGLAWARSGVTKARRGQVRRLEIVESLRVEQQRHILLVRVDGAELLVGVSEQGMQALAPLGAVTGSFSARSVEVVS